MAVGSQAVPPPSFGVSIAEMAFLTVVAGAAALIPVAAAVHVLRRTDAYNTTTATVTKVVIGTVVTALVVRKMNS
jgi:hypothetical protein